MSEIAHASDYDFEETHSTAPVESVRDEARQEDHPTDNKTSMTNQVNDTFESDHREQGLLKSSEPRNVLHNVAGAMEHTGASLSERPCSPRIQATKTMRDDGSQLNFVGRNWVHRSEAHVARDNNNPWAGRAILSLDGGGIRGYASLVILKSLMDKISEFEETGAGSSDGPPKDRTGKVPKDNQTPHSRKTSPASKYRPYHYFDLIGGTSTGGLIAIMLGRLRMSVDEAMREYRNLGEKVFGLSSKLSKWPRFGHGDLDPKAFGEAIKNAFHKLPPEQRSPDEQDEDFRSDPMRCKIVLCSMTINKSNSYAEPFLFRSYPLPSHLNSDEYPPLRNPGPASSCKIWEAARATSAAPFYFEPFLLGGSEYIDAAPFVNNPSWEVYKECKALEDTSSSHIDLFLSVGNGPTSQMLRPTHLGKMKSYFNLVSKVQEAKTMQILSDRVDHAVKESLFSEETYYRFNVDPGKKDSFERVKKATLDYLSRPEVKEMAEMCAFILVQSRKRREKTMRWELFAEGTRYRCPIPSCREEPSSSRTRVELKDHLQVVHGKLSDMDHHEEMLQLLNEGRVGYATSERGSLP